LLLVAGCVVGPELERPATAVDGVNAWQNADDIDHVADVGGPWWQAFGDAASDQLIERALKGNLDINRAAAAVLEARALLAVATGRRLPTVGLTVGASRQQQSFDLPGGRANFLSNNYNVGPTVRWQADLFGKLRRAEQSAAARLLAADADRIAVRHSVIAELLRSRVLIATLQNRVRLAEDNVDSLGQTLAVVESFYEAGAGRVTALDVRLARQNLANARSQLPPLVRQLGQARLALDVLLGVLPGTTADQAVDLPPLPELAALPNVVPAALLDRRPDLLAAEFRTLAAQSDIGVEVADLFPSLQLDLTAGFAASELNDLLDADSQTWNIGGSLFVPLFTGFTETNEIEAVRARAQQLAYDYAQQVLRAVQEVESALIAERQDRAELAAAQSSLSEAQAAEELARDRYERGVEPLLSVFEAERRRRASEEQVAVVRQSVWASRIDLHLALGGDWQLPNAGVERNEVLQGPTTQPGWPKLRPELQLDVPGAPAMEMWEAPETPEMMDEVR
jgi:NodT family efflux transporter outer membrane factor (OMF) lipoprotein